MKKRSLKMHALLACLLGLVLALELVSGSGLTAAASAKIILKNGAAAPDSIYTGQSCILKVRGAGQSVKFYSSNKNIAAIDATTGKMRAVAPGKVKITAKAAKNGRRVATKTFSVLLRSKWIRVEEQKINLSRPGDTSQIEVVLRPENSTDVIRFSSDDETVAAVGAASGKVTARGMGHTTIRVYAKAAEATANSAKANKTAVVDVYVTGESVLVDAFQGSFTEVRAVFDGNIRDAHLGAQDFTLRQEGGDVVPVQSIKVTGDKEATLYLAARMKGNTDYILKWKTYSASFKTIAEKVCSVEITPEKAKLDVPTEIMVTWKGEEGIVLGTCQYGQPDFPEEVTMSVKVTGGAIDTYNKKLTFTSLQGYAEAEAVYKGADGSVIRAKKVITAAPKEVEILYSPGIIKEATVSQITIFVGDIRSGKGDYYTYGRDVLPDYLQVTITPTNGFAEPAAGGLYLANAWATAKIHIEYEKDGSAAKTDGTIYARAKTEAEKAAEKAEQEKQSSSSSSSTPTPEPVAASEPDAAPEPRVDPEPVVSTIM